MTNTDSGEGEKIEELSHRIEQLEEALRDVARPYSELTDQIVRFQEIVEKYFKLMDLYQKHGSISVDTVLPQVKDRISKEIMKILLDKSKLNISEVTRELRARTGSASRRIVRDRLSDLVDKGLLVENVGNRSKTYEISESVIKKWSQVLGLSK